MESTLETLNGIVGMLWSSITMYLIEISVVIISTITASILVFTLKKQVDSTYMQVLRNVIDKLYELYKREEYLKYKNDCELFAIRLLDIMAHLAHLNLQGKIDDRLLEFLSYDFSIARRMMVWFDEHKLGEKYDSTASEIWLNLTKYYEKNPQIELASEDVLPTSLIKFSFLEVGMFVYGTLMDNLTRTILLKRQVLTTSDILNDYYITEIPIDSKKYPIAFPCKNKQINGLLIYLTPDEIEILDKYEGSNYKRIQVKLNSGKNAQVYVNVNSVSEK